MKAPRPQSAVAIAGNILLYFGVRGVAQVMWCVKRVCVCMCALRVGLIIRMFTSVSAVCVRNAWVQDVRFVYGYNRERARIMQGPFAVYPLCCSLAVC